MNCRRIIFVSLFVISQVFCFKLTAQNIGRFKTNLIWEVTKVVYEEPTPSAHRDFYSYYYFFDGDTLIEDTLYSTLMARQFHHTGRSSNGTTFEDSTLYAAIPEAFFYHDSTSSITYIRLPGGNKAFPRYYSNLEIGDTIRYYELKNFPNGEFYTDFVVQDKDSVTYFGNIYFKLTLGDSPSYIENEIVGGLGGGNGLIHYLRYLPDNDYEYIGCMNIDNVYELYDPNTQTLECNFDYSPDQITKVERIEKSRLPIMVFPNPATSTLTVDISNDRIKEIQIFSSLGARVSLESKAEINSNFITIDITLLPKGVYYIHVGSQSGHLYVEKLIKK